MKINDEIFYRAFREFQYQEKVTHLDVAEWAYWYAWNMALQSACNAICKGCQKKWPESDGVHARQVLKQKDKQGHFIYNPVMIDCIAIPIKKLMAGGA